MFNIFCISVLRLFLTSLELTLRVNEPESGDRLFLDGDLEFGIYFRSSSGFIAELESGAFNWRGWNARIRLESWSCSLNQIRNVKIIKHTVACKAVTWIPSSKTIYKHIQLLQGSFLSSFRHCTSNLSDCTYFISACSNYLTVFTYYPSDFTQSLSICTYYLSVCIYYYPFVCIYYLSVCTYY